MLPYQPANGPHPKLDFIRAAIDANKLIVIEHQPWHHQGWGHDPHPNPLIAKAYDAPAQQHPDDYDGIPI